ncbi:acyl-CoA thioesterase [Hydrotalea sp.]|uniref:acyl-CoA thioesterase n=1 Tax=Hydrotalea sp. TaxID=2881279 RepID=UPI003D0A1EDB
MESFYTNVTIRWSDLDPNFHVRHSVYYDWGAYARMNFLTYAGISLSLLMQHRIGVILLREEAIFKKEIHYNDIVKISIKMRSITASGDRWSLQHELQNSNGIIHAIINIDGAWMNTEIRKLVAPPSSFQEMFLTIPKTNDFKIV